MRVLDEASRFPVKQAIGRHLDELRKIPGFVGAEPGFPVVGGEVLQEPAVLVFVAEKKPRDHLLASERAPRRLETYRVAVMQADPHRQLAALTETFGELLPALSSDDLTYEQIEGNPIDDEFQVAGKFLCHAGPDAGWPILKPYLAGAKTSLSVAMYDFNADHIVTAFIEAVEANRLATMLTWDDGMTPNETEVRKRLRQALGAKLDGWIVRCGGGKRFASAYHEKVAVRDAESFWLSSGNWSWRSQPDLDPIGRPADAKAMFSRGNREWHVIVDDAPMAKLFERYIKYDRDGSEAEKKAGTGGAALAVDESPDFPDLFVPLASVVTTAESSIPEPAAPATLPTAVRKVTVQPVLTPDNYLGRVRELIASAERTLYLQYAYITYSDAARDKPFTEMLLDLATRSYKPGLDVRVIVGSADAADKVRMLVEAGFNPNVFRVQSSIHNKGIVADGERVLVSSANWSSDGVLRNRDAGLIIHDGEIADYYQRVFLDDWDNRARAKLDDGIAARVARPEERTPPGMVRMDGVERLLRVDFRLNEVGHAASFCSWRRHAAVGGISGCGQTARRLVSLARLRPQGNSHRQSGLGQFWRRIRRGSSLAARPKRQ